MSAFMERITGSQSPLSSERSLRWSLTLIRLGPAIILLLLIIAFNLLSPVFLTVQNVSNIVAQTSALAVLAIGQLFVILVAGIDLSEAMHSSSRGTRVSVVRSASLPSYSPA